MTETSQSFESTVGESIPSSTPHAISVSLPTWKANVGYEEGQEWVISKMKTGYPRFFIHLSIRRFAKAIVDKHGSPGENAMLFPSHIVAQRCVDFLLRRSKAASPPQLRILDLVQRTTDDEGAQEKFVSPKMSAVMFPEDQFDVAKSFWQHTGNGISSRLAEYCYEMFQTGILVDRTGLEEEKSLYKGPRRYQRRVPMNSSDNPSGANGSGAHNVPESAEHDSKDSNCFVEERFGRNLELSLSSYAKLAIKRRIAGIVTTDMDLKDPISPSNSNKTKRPVEGFSEDDVYLYPCGMNAIYNAHRSLLASRGPLKSVSYGFPYIDTLKLLEKFGPGCLFYGHGNSDDLDDLEQRLKDGEKYLAVFCEFPSNPLLKSPDLLRLRQLANQYDFAVVVDETIGNFLNIQVISYADIVVSSLTKIFSGASNVMGGSAVLNPQSKYYSQLKQLWSDEYEDNYWPEDAIFMERNSRDFVYRNKRINSNAESICDVLLAHPKVKKVYYPKYCTTRPLYDRCRTSCGGYGGLLSVTFHNHAEAVSFFDYLKSEKGPSLGTNFTLSSPYVILAHFNELSWAESFGVESDLIRFSVGLEDTVSLVTIFSQALAAIEEA